MNRVRENSRQKVSGLGVGNKRKADVSPKKEDTKKRSALGDLTNAAKKAAGLNAGKAGSKENRVEQKGKEVKPEKISLIPKFSERENPRVTRAKSKSLKGNEGAVKVERNVVEPLKAHGTSRALKEVNTNAVGRLTRRSTKTVTQKQNEEKHDSTVSISSTEEESLYETAHSSSVLESSPSATLSTEEAQNRHNAMTEKVSIRTLPVGVHDYDKEVENDPFQVGLYASDIFAYYKRRELRFPIKRYLDAQTELNRNMRSILVDWMVEVQESFEMNHETLYLAVKLVDMFLGKSTVKRDKLQLVGTTSLYIAAKYDERCPPVIDDFCYICDDAYSQREVIEMEERILRALQFDIGVPLSYRFLRRYARSAKLDMETLTLARYILEMSLMDYEFIDTRDSVMAASALLLALKMKVTKPGDPWNATLKYYTSYTVEDIFDTTHRLYAYMRRPQTHLKTIRSKYSHKVFFEVAKIPLPEELHIQTV